MISVTRTNAFRSRQPWLPSVNHLGSSKNSPCPGLLSARRPRTTGMGPRHLLELLTGRSSKKEPRKAADPTRTPTPEEKELHENPGGKASGPGPAGSPVGQTPYLVGLGLHGHYCVEGNHEDHHGHPGQHGGSQVLRKEREQAFTQGFHLLRCPMLSAR